jgi:tripartite-type tricarboxylate transporter receptor subunit TctC
MSISLSRRHWINAAGAAALASSLPCALAQSWPAKPITLVNPYAPGGGLDPVARLMAQELSKRLGQQMVVENRTGAGGMIGANAVAKAAKDGYTLLISTASEIAINQHLTQNKPQFDSLKDLAPISLVVRLPFVLIAHPSAPYNNVKELIDFAKKNPGKVSYASAGNGTIQHLAGELFKSLSKTFMVHIPYRGVAPATADVLAGTVPLAFAGFPTVIQQIKAGRLKALGVTSAARMQQAPEIPTVQESLLGFQLAQWFAMWAPAGTPPEVMERMNREVNAVLSDATVRNTLMGQGAEPIPGSAQTLGEFAALQSQQFQRLIKVMNIKADA